jgi:integrase
VNFVEPIRDPKKIAQIKNLLRGQGRYRELLLFVVGINRALRISDLLPLTIGDFLDKQSKIRLRFWIREKKRGKRQEVTIDSSIREALGEYLEAYPGIIKHPERFVFFSTQSPTYAEPIKRGQAWKFISSICREVGLTGNYGTHTLRKT